MAKLTNLPFLRHVRSDPSRHLILFKHGRVKRSGRGLAFWFSPLSAGLVEVPCDDREVDFLVQARSNDFQDVNASGSITYRVVDAELLAARVDFTIDPSSGRHLEQPLERLADIFTHLAQRIGAEYVTTTPVREALAEGVREIRARVADALTAEASLSEMGLEVVAVHVSAVTPTSELEKALQAPTRESIQQRSDEATFQRRALAVEKERAIRENEMQSRIELAKREETLIAQEGQNQQRQALELAEAEAITVRATVDNDRLQADATADMTRVEAAALAEAERLRTSAEAEGIAAVETARVEAERGRMEIYGGLPPHVLLGLAARELAGKLQKIDRVQITPEGIAPLLTDLADAGARLLESRATVATAEEA